MNGKKTPDNDSTTLPLPSGQERKTRHFGVFFLYGASKGVRFCHCLLLGFSVTPCLFPVKCSVSFVFFCRHPPGMPPVFWQSYRVLVGGYQGNTHQVLIVKLLRCCAGARAVIGRTARSSKKRDFHSAAQDSPKSRENVAEGTFW